MLTVLVLAADAPAYRRAEWPWVQEGCQTTRTRVLIRDARHVDLDEDECKVVAGAWYDKLTGRDLTDPRQVDIDHTVPLAWAHAHGGHAWTRMQKRAFANFLEYRYHLQAVDLRANRAKGAKGPEAWRPPNPDAWCQYAQSYATILVIWGLEPTPPTRDAIRDMATTC